MVHELAKKFAPYDILPLDTNVPNIINGFLSHIRETKETSKIYKNTPTEMDGSSVEHFYKINLQQISKKTSLKSFFYFVVSHLQLSKESELMNE